MWAFVLGVWLSGLSALYYGLICSDTGYVVCIAQSLFTCFFISVFLRKREREGARGSESGTTEHGK